MTSKNNKYILTVVDHATHWVEAYPLPDHRAVTVAKTFSDFIARFGIPDEVLHDLGADFTSEFFQVYLNFYGISQLKCSVAHPQTNTACERTHRTLKAMLTAYVGQNKGEWDDVLCHVLFAFREIPIAEFGFSPYEMLFGRHVRGPLSIVFDSWWEGGENKASSHVVDYMMSLREQVQNALEIVHKGQQEAQVKAKTYYDKKARVISYSPGDAVLVLQKQIGKSLSLKYSGPFEVIKQVSPVDYLVNFPGRRKDKRVIHVNLLRKYHKRVEFVESVNSVIINNAYDDDEMFESLLDKKKLLTLIQF